MKLSIIIPVINEAENLQKALTSLQYLRKKGHEVILVDGGSTDTSCFIARPMVDILLNSEPGRARQMNLGAEKANGEILVFLHADTLLPYNVEEIFKCIPEASFWGRFDVVLSGKWWGYRVIERLINLRSRLSGIATGDQVIFVTRDLFELVNGYPNIPIMEDIAISKIFKKIIRPVCRLEKVITSSRRWEEKGAVRTIWLMWRLRMEYALGVSPGKLAKLYD
jgi:rSAM/selenodomain-associated transferase 2